MYSPARSARLAPVLGGVLGLLAACAHTPEATQSETSEPAGRSPQDRSTVTAEDIERQPGEPIERVLEGRISGVEVFRTADGIVVRIRGSSSLLGGNEPLFIVDGVPITPGPGGALRGLSPHNIESIEVLKDPVDTTMYGLRGANGVIVIKTKGPPQ